MTTRRERTAAVRFFRDHAGTSYRPDVETRAQGTYRNARRLAAAEEWATRTGAEMVWTDDWEVVHTNEFPDAYDAEPTTCEYAMLVDKDGETLAALGCIDDASDNYRRVVAAELALEVMPR